MARGRQFRGVMRARQGEARFSVYTWSTPSTVAIPVPFRWICVQSQPTVIPLRGDISPEVPNNFNVNRERDSVVPVNLDHSHISLIILSLSGEKLPCLFVSFRLHFPQNETGSGKENMCAWTNINQPRFIILSVVHLCNNKSVCKEVYPTTYDVRLR